jgi:rSAM/selenodomain-associated transferase 1
MKRALVVVGKVPHPGSTKTRLVPPLTLEQAAALYRAFLQDTLALGRELRWECVTLVYPPLPDAERELRSFVPKEIQLLPQPGSGLGAALAGAFASHLTARYGRVVLIGSDNPTLPAEIVERAADGLDEHDLVVGPSTDGGYYLIGMSQPHLGVFERISWSTSVVFAETLERADELGLRVLRLPEWYDVDTDAELCRLRDELTTLPPSAAPATRAALAELRC